MARKLLLLCGLLASLLYIGMNVFVPLRWSGYSSASQTVSELSAIGALSFFWPSMHVRGDELTLTDTLHVVFAMLMLLLMALEIGFGAAALGRGFRLYSIATLLVFVVFGALTTMDASKVAENLPTPWIGVWERVNIAAYMVWLGVLAAILLFRSATRRVAAVET